MKKKGNKTECNAQRNAELIKVMRQQVLDAQCLRIQELAAEATKAPASRYWVSEERAAMVISLMKRGENPLTGMRPSKRRMYQDIYAKVLALEIKYPASPLVELVSMVIYCPAPEFYMAPCYAQQLWYKSLGGHRSGRAEA